MPKGLSIRRCLYPEIIQIGHKHTDTLPSCWPGSIPADNVLFGDHVLAKSTSPLLSSTCSDVKLRSAVDNRPACGQTRTLRATTNRSLRTPAQRMATGKARLLWGQLCIYLVSGKKDESWSQRPSTRSQQWQARPSRLLDMAWTWMTHRMGHEKNPDLESRAMPSTFVSPGWWCDRKKLCASSMAEDLMPQGQLHVRSKRRPCSHSHYSERQRLQSDIDLRESERIFVRQDVPSYAASGRVQRKSSSFLSVVIHSIHVVPRFSLEEARCRQSSPRRLQFSSAMALEPQPDHRIGMACDTEPQYRLERVG
jgi:hypothetical protein